MQTDDLIQQLMALPLPDRVVVAQELWESIDETLSEASADEQKDAAQTAMRRHAELTSGAVTSRTHEEVMEAARRSLA